MKLPRIAQEKLSRLSAIALMLLLGATASFAQAKFTSIASGSWSSASTWQLVSGTDSDGIPDANDTVTIAGPHQIAMGNATANCANLTVNAGGEALLNGSGSLRINAAPGAATINGLVTMSSSGTLTETGSGTRTLTVGATGRITISGSATFPSFDIYDLDPASTVEFTASANQTIKSGVVFGNLTLGGSGTKQVAPIPADTAFWCSGTLTVGAGVTFDVSTNILYIHFSGNVVNNGIIDASQGVTILVMTGSSWTNNGSFLPSVTPLLGYLPSTTFVNTTFSGTGPITTFYDLIIEGTFSAPANLTVSRNVIINSGSILNAGDGLQHNVGGSWINNGTFNASTSTIVFNGTATQNIAATGFHAVEVRNPAGVQLTGNVSILSGGSLHLYAGNLTTGSSTLSILSSNPAALVLDTNRVTGTVLRTIAPASTGTYNFFSSNAYLIPGGTGNPSSVTMTVLTGTNPPNLWLPGDTAKVAKRYYTMSAAGIGTGFFYTLRLPYAQSEVRGNESKYSLWQDGGSGWIDVGTSSTPDTAGNFVEQVGLTGASSWMIGETSGALPIQISSFSASLLQNTGGVRLDWTTVSEINSYGFYVQRSASATGVFTDLPGGFVAGQGMSVEPHSYHWTDALPLQGTAYYRLRKVDRDGSQEFTDPVEVTNSVTAIASGMAPAEFALAQNYPNPFNPTTTIQFSVENPGHALLKVYTILGAEVATLFEGHAEPGRVYAVTFDATSLANGTYFYRLVSGEQSSIRKAVLLK
jgi:hypothetical protein